MKSLVRAVDKEEIARRLRDVRPDSSRRWGRMSAHQMICHLCDSIEMATGEKWVSEVAGPLPRTMMKWVALYIPLPWPAGIRSSPEVDSELGGTRPGDFAADVAKLQAILERMTARPGNFEWPPHPSLGRMSGGAWLRWGYVHADHHLRQFGR